MVLAVLRAGGATRAATSITTATDVIRDAAATTATITEAAPTTATTPSSWTCRRASPWVPTALYTRPTLRLAARRRRQTPRLAAGAGVGSGSGAVATPLSTAEGCRPSITVVVLLAHLILLQRRRPPSSSGASCGGRRVGTRSRRLSHSTREATSVTARGGMREEDPAQLRARNERQRVAARAGKATGQREEKKARLVIIIWLRLGAVCQCMTGGGGPCRQGCGWGWVG